MMTAEAIIKSRILVRNDMTDATMSDLEDMINEARKEAIEECAERAELDFKATGVCEVDHFVDKQSILSLIKELK